ncbi:MAG: undecaprenyl-diphosphate phosphatase [Dethiobacteria bacterium]|nr:undecaprenyl-diphosphate phosphatase [Bacillota bacterium]HOP68471.1 undecaprenyl-diphosphate phosphatase [Bacillota bacterium]HPT33576.1 undecaprenyl-diphosphate phosphatase [Bacillota bacterium]HPZ64079.1 undecaprenyl-diphosphate phosphatase [Bacillota bacterium]HQD06914.1 undecaprenyl-diphosphate phosphatase [Bacillota bacterium]
MNLLEAIVLGLIQGLTEFLPVSSSGHLVLAQNLLGIQQPGVTLEVLLHFGTLLSVFWVFGRDFLDLLRFPKDSLQRRFLLLLLVGIVPTAVIGLLLEDYMDQIFMSNRMVGLMLLVTGVMLLVLTRLPQGRKGIGQMKTVDALWVGLFQGIAVIPGISRSGATITGAIWRGLDRPAAVRYSFMLAAPVILGLTLLELKDLLSLGLEREMLVNYAAGSLVAFLSGILAIKFFIKLLQQEKFHYFAFYCWVAGLITIFLPAA